MEGLFSHKLPKLYVTQSGSIHDFLVFSSLAETRMKVRIERAETREFWLRKVCVSNVLLVGQISGSKSMDENTN